MKVGVTENRFHKFIQRYPHFENLTFIDDKNNFGRRVIKDKKTGKNVASIQRFVNAKPICFIDN